MTPLEILLTCILVFIAGALVGSLIGSSSSDDWDFRGL